MFFSRITRIALMFSPFPIGFYIGTLLSGEMLSRGLEAWVILLAFVVALLGSAFLKMPRAWPLGPALLMLAGILLGECGPDPHNHGSVIGFVCLFFGISWTIRGLLELYQPVQSTQQA